MNEFIATLAPYAVKHGTAANVLPSLIIAQGILESGGGKSELAVEANNLFGIKKGSGWDGEVHAVVTGEYRKNALGEDEYYEIVAEFRKYPSYEGAVIDLCAKYTQGLDWETHNRYAAVVGELDFATAAHAVKAAGYATDPNYPSKLINIHEHYDLGQFDIGIVEEVIEEIVDDLTEIIDIIEEEPTMAFKVAVDAGHGINTPGKRTPAGEREWTFNNVVALALIAELQNYEGVEVLRVDDPTGRTDVSLNSRAAKANSWGADVYVSIHHNANTGKWGTWTGTETFVMQGSSGASGAMKLARAVHPELVKAMGLKDRGIKQANFAVLRQTKMPAILTEGGYMDSTIDIVVMRNDSKLRLAGANIAKGVASYGNLKRKSGGDVKPVVKPATYLYRVRKSWADDASQKGAFADLDGAIAIAKANAGYKVFDQSGKQVFPVVLVSAPNNDSLYRVRKTWGDASSQIGAFSELSGAKELADKNTSYKVYDGNGKEVYNPTKAKEEAAKLAEQAKQDAAKKQYEAEYQTAIDLGITDGSRPNDAPTREQVAVMIVRAMNLKK